MVDILFVAQPRLNGIPAPKEIDCSNPQKDYIIQPLGIAYLTSAARDSGCSVALVDLNVIDKDYDYLEPIIQKEKPKLIVGGYTTASMYVDMKLGELAKKYNIPFGIWGNQPSSLRERLFSEFKLDFIIENEPEMTMKEIAENLKNGKKNIFAKVKGLSYKEKGKVIFNDYRKLEPNLDSLPIPAYDLLPLDKYRIPYNRRLPMTLMRTSRGCIAKCSFCVIGGQIDYRRGYGSIWRAYSPERALKEIELVVKKYGIKEIDFFDSEFTINKQRVIDICKGIIERKLNVIWNCNARVDMVDEEMLNWMKKAGCFGIGFGVETADKKILENCKKNITLEQVEKAIQMVKKAGISPALYFMIGLPGETEETIKKTISFAKRLAIQYNLRPQCTMATPYPGTVFYEMAEKNKWIKEDVDQLEQTTASIAYPNLSQEQLKYWHAQFYKQVVLNPRRLFLRVLRIRHINEVKSIPIHLRDFLYGLSNKMKYVR